ncbi:hypothetical protein KJ885_03350 [Patescibacteria group bacterium]|nr:hypothetical protein [Patescibacteria group bacterium]
MTLVKFSCPFESMPPQGGGQVIASTGATLALDNGHLMYQGEPVVLGSEEEED